MKKPTGGSPWSNLWLSAEPLLGPIRYPRFSIGLYFGCGCAALDFSD